MAVLAAAALAACGAPKVAAVNGEKITVAAYGQRLRVAASQGDFAWLRQPERAKAFKEKLLNDMIDEALLLQEAKRLDITANDTELAEEYNRYKSQYTEEAFQKMLAGRGISYDTWKDERRQAYLIDKLRNAVAPEANKITEAELKSFYDQNIADFKRPEEVRVRQILVGKDSTAQMIHEKLLAGENFAALAQQYSISPDARNGGDVGYFSRGSFPAVFDKVCFSLPVGAVSDVTKSEYGYHLFKVTDHRPARTIPFPEAKKMILRSLRQEGGQKLFDELLAQRRQSAQIDIDTHALDNIEVPHAESPSHPDTH